MSDPAHLFPIYVRQGSNPRNFRSGFIDAAGNVAIPVEFDDARVFNEGLAAAKKRLWGAIDSLGRVVIPYAYNEIGLRFSEGMIDFSKNRRRGLLSRNGTVMVEPARYWTISDFSESLACVWDGRLYGFIDETGREVIPCFFEDARRFSEGVAPVKLRGKWGYVNKRASFVLEPTFEMAHAFQGRLARAKLEQKWGFIERSGKFVIQPQFAEAFSFSEGLASVVWEGKGLRGYIDQTGKTVIQPKYQRAMPFSEGFARVTAVGQRGLHFINASGEPVFGREFLAAGAFSHGLSLVSDLETLAYINTEGRTVWEGPYVDGR